MMSSLSAFLFSLALAWPLPPAPAAPVEEAAESGSRARAQDAVAVWQQLARAFRDSDAAQVRIEQRIILRIAPMPGPTRESLLALSPTAPVAPRMLERPMGECIAMNAIAGGQPQRGSRLLLFMRDRRLIAADLEKACSARDFYSGFYVVRPNADGRLCATRDRVLARSGARCQITAFRQLVASD